MRDHQARPGSARACYERVEARRSEDIVGAGLRRRVRDSCFWSCLDAARLVPPRQACRWRPLLVDSRAMHGAVVFQWGPANLHARTHKRARKQESRKVSALCMAWSFASQRRLLPRLAVQGLHSAHQLDCSHTPVNHRYHTTPGVPHPPQRHMPIHSITLWFDRCHQYEKVLLCTLGTAECHLHPAASWFSCCFRMDHVEAFFSELVRPEQTTGFPPAHRPKKEDSGMTIGALIDPDGSLIRLIQI
ncbi:hypothetical protein P171DRAFT_132472 [Karstenula rhodostoma CBS 690.94]|uniref:VOC domain-containing protein n=1 Tax=Karstenula rhodostoma CBS 690.94 TaxID=1392251 RepID=A0A9P4P697_9PLEO|nr:hypothetical protein P171DRAFT_132472 [Karstenula rhodostoma CBS 690.94]